MRRVALACAALIGVLATPGSRAQTPPSRSQLLLVIDGLRPDYVTADMMPRLHALGQRGIVFNAHHSVFPTVTRVNSSSMSTGAYPESHGLLGNTVYSEKASPTRGLDTSKVADLVSMEKAEGVLLTAPTLGESLERAGKKFLVVSAGSTGSAMLLNHPMHGGVINAELFQPPALETMLASTLGTPPATAVPNNLLNKWAVDAYLSYGLKELKSDVTAIWFGDPDETAHQKGIGSATTRQSLRYVDAEIGRIEDTLLAQGLFDRTNILVISDHGFVTYKGGFTLAAFVAPFAKPMPDGSPDIVVAEGSVNFRGARDPARIAAVVAELQRHPEVGAIFTRPASPGSMAGVVAGTLSFNVPRWNHGRSADILVSANWSNDTNDAGFAGASTQRGVAGHGASSPYEIHNTFLAAGPDFREHATSGVPTANVDIAPTLLKLMGVAIPSTMTGRVVEEALRTGPAPSSLRVEDSVESAHTADWAYQVDAHISTAAGRRYFDYTEVKRTTPR